MGLRIVLESPNILYSEDIFRQLGHWWKIGIFLEK